MFFIYEIAIFYISLFLYKCKRNKSVKNHTQSIFRGIRDTHILTHFTHHTLHTYEECKKELSFQEPLKKGFFFAKNSLNKI